MRREHLSTPFGLWLASALLLGLAACGGHIRLSGAAQQAAQNKPAPIAAPAPVAASGSRNVLRLTTPELAKLSAGSEFDVTLSATTVEPLFQASARLLFDPAQLEPVQAVPAELGTGYVSLARADAALRFNAGGFVPYSFTGLPGGSGLPPAVRELVRVRFRVKQAITGNAGLRLLSDPAYLQLRGPDGRRLSFDLSEEVAAR